MHFPMIAARRGGYASTRPGPGRDQAGRLDAAPFDGEELTDEDHRAVKEARSEPGLSWPEAETR